MYPIDYTYCSETWTISKHVQDKMSGFEMWCRDKMQRVSWTARMSKVNVRKLSCGQASLLKDNKERQFRFLGHVIRKQQQEKLALKGKIEGKRQEESRGFSTTVFGKSQLHHPCCQKSKILELFFLQMRRLTFVNRYDVEKRRRMAILSAPKL